MSFDVYKFYDDLYKRQDRKQNEVHTGNEKSF